MSSIHRPIEERNAEAVRRATALLHELPSGPRFTWDFRQYDMMSNLVRDGGLNNFLEWPIVSEALYAGYTPINKRERARLPQSLRNLSVDFQPPPNPPPVSPEGASGTYIKQTVLLAEFAASFLSPGGIEDLSSVYEVGGGYGAMAVMLSRLGFDGEHVVLDLPALHVIREWYLEGANVLTKSTDGPAKKDVDLLISVHSLCEMPVQKREEILSNVRAKYYIFSITRTFDGINNAKWFREWCQDQGLIYRDWFPWTWHTQDVIIAGRH